MSPEGSTGGYPPGDYYPPPGYPPPGSYPPPGHGGYPPPGYPRRPTTQSAARRPPQAPTTQSRQRSGLGPRAPMGNQRTLVWVIVVVAVVVILFRVHRISSTEVIFFCVLIPSVILHEIAHGVVALWLGDDTAKRAGRLTLNPLPHVTLFGTIIVPAILLISGFGFFGWAKPVPVDVRRLRHPRNDTVLVSLAGPFTNVVLSAICGLIFYLVFVMGHSYVQTTLPVRIVAYAGIVNLWVACFNMLPIPPLDGSALVERLLPASWWPSYLRLRPYGFFIIFGALMLMSFTGIYPTAAVFGHLETWWLRLVHAYA